MYLNMVKPIDYKPYICSRYQKNTIKPKAGLVLMNKH